MSPETNIYLNKGRKRKNTTWSLKSMLPYQYIIPLCFSDLSITCHSHCIHTLFNSFQRTFHLTLESQQPPWVSSSSRLSSSLSSAKSFIMPLHYLLSVAGSINSTNLKILHVSYFNLTYFHLIPSTQSLFQKRNKKKQSFYSSLMLTLLISASVV